MTACAKASGCPDSAPGKVPRALLEKMYRRQVEDEVARELVERSIGQAIRENQIQPVAPPAVAEIEIKNGEPFKFSARVEVRASVTPQDYSGVPLSRRPPKVTDEQVQEALEGYRKRLTQFKPVEGRTETGARDLVRVELTGKVGEHKIKRREVVVDLEDEVGGPLPGLASAPARQTVRRRGDVRGGLHAARRGGPGRARRPPREAERASSRRRAKSRSPRWTTSWPRTPARPRRWTACAPRFARS